MATAEFQLNDLIQQYGSDVLRYAYLFLQDYGLAEDISQEVFVRAYQNLERFRGDSSYRTWLLRITINACKDLRKSKRYRQWQQEHPLPPAVGTTPTDPLDVAAEQELIRQALQTLPLKDREVVVLRYYGGFSSGEIAELLGSSANAVSSRLSRALGKLRQQLQGRVEL